MILQATPTNTRARFTLARAYGLVRAAYPAAFLEYDKLLKTDPDLIQARKELARLLYGAHHYHEGDAVYMVAQYPSPDETLQTVLGKLTPPWHRKVEPFVAPSNILPLLPFLQPAPPGTQPEPLPPPQIDQASYQEAVVPISKEDDRPDADDYPGEKDGKSNARGARQGRSVLPQVERPWSASTRSHPEAKGLAAIRNGPRARIDKNGNKNDKSANDSKYGRSSKDDKSSKNEKANKNDKSDKSNKGDKKIDKSEKKDNKGDKNDRSNNAKNGESKPYEVASQPKLVDETDPAVLCAWREKRAQYDYEARRAEVVELRQEQFAKSKKDLRNREAVAAYITLLETQPANTSAMFDLHEMFAALGETRAAIGQLSTLQQVEPYNRDAIVARERAEAFLLPRARFQGDILAQYGRDFLVGIQNNKYTTQVVYPYADETDFIGVGYSRNIYRPQNDRPLHGNIATVLLGKQWDRLRFNSQVNYEQYPDRFSDRVTYNALLSYDVNDVFRARAGSFLENWAQNSETLIQDIYRYGVEVGGDFHFTRRWDAMAHYRLWRYSDDNFLHNALLRTSYKFLPPPFELDFIFTAELFSYEEETVRASIDPRVLTGTIHPYFAPQGFWFFDNRVRIKHHLGRDLFKYSKQRYYALEYGLGLDNQGQIYNDFRLVFNYDITNYITVGASASAIVSRVYKAGFGFAFLEIRFPPLH
jgi:hypothetical protein